MGFFGFGNHSHNEADLSTAKDFIRDQTALYRHYCITEVRLHVEQFTGVNLSDEEAITIVQGIRREKGMGPIKDYNLPGYADLLLSIFSAIIRETNGTGAAWIWASLLTERSGGYRIRLTACSGQRTERLKGITSFGGDALFGLEW